MPIYQAKIFEKRVNEFGSPIKIIVKPGQDHGWVGMDKDMEVFAQWFDDYLLQNTKLQTPNSKHQTPNTKLQTPNSK